MGKRRKARECAIQCLYQWDMTGSDVGTLLEGYWEAHPSSSEVAEFTEHLVRGTLAHVAEIDPLIGAQAEHWRVDRIGKVERSILRLGAYELLYEPDTPQAVVIDEAIEISKRYCGPDAGHFVNGVLDGIREKIGSSESDAAPTESA
jgi:N utilization substance protein B